MQIRRSHQKGTLREVLSMIDALTVRCEMLEKEVCSLGMQRRLDRALARIAQLEAAKEETPAELETPAK